MKLHPTNRSRLITNRTRGAIDVRTAFTLVELLVVMVILGLMAGMIIVAIRGVQQQTRIARTRSVIAACDSVIRDLYQSYQYRPLAVEIPDTFNPAARTGTEIGFEVLSTETARIRLMMIRDLQRMEIPDRLSDLGPMPSDVGYSAVISASPKLLRGAASPVLLDAGGNIVGARDSRPLRRMFPVVWYGQGVTTADVQNANIPSRMAGYRDRLPIGIDVTNATLVANQGAECLYLIMSSTVIGGAPAIDSIPTSSIGDTDEDGLPEILDGWGRPLYFIRWPIGYFGPEGNVDLTKPDEFDLFRSDYAYWSSNAAALALNVQTSPASGVVPWSIQPLIASAGSDGEFGIAVNPWSNLTTEVPTFSYQNFAFHWPVDTAHYGAVSGGELGGRDKGAGATTFTEHAYPDPYLRRFVELNRVSGVFPGLLPGQLLPGDDNLEFRADNISSYETSGGLE